MGLNPGLDRHISPFPLQHITDRQMERHIKYEILSLKYSYFDFIFKVLAAMEDGIIG